MVEKTSVANGAQPETIQSGEPVKTKPVATMTDSRPDDQLEVTGGGAYPLPRGNYNTGIGG